MSYGVVVATRAPASRAWVTRRLAPRNVDLGAQALAFGAHGQSAAAWTERAGPTSVVMLSCRSPGGSFGPPRPVVNEPTGAGLYALHIGFDSAGRPTLAMERGGVVQAGPLVQAGPAVSTRAARVLVTPAVQVADGDASGHFGPLQVVQPDCVIADFDQAPSGAAAIAMGCGDAGTHQVHVSRRQPGGRFGPPLLASGDGRDDYRPSLALSDDGHTTLAWFHRRRRVNGDHQSVRIQLADARPGQAFSPPRAVTAYADLPDPFSIVKDPRGRLYLAWLNRHAALRLARITPANRLSHARTLSPPRIDRPRLAIDTAGRGIAVWQVYRRRDRIQATTFRLAR